MSSMIPSGPPGMPPESSVAALQTRSLVLVDGELSEAQQLAITRALEQLKERREGYRLLRSYYGGHQRLLFSTEKWRNAFGPLFATLADNLCAAVVDAAADRLQVTGFGVEVPTAEKAKQRAKLRSDRVQATQATTAALLRVQSGQAAAGLPTRTTDAGYTAAGPTPPVSMQEPDPASDPGAAAWDLWQAARMDQFAGETHLEALKAGDAYVIVWRDQEGLPTIYPQRADQCTVYYDDAVPGKIQWGAKLWCRDDGRYRINLFFDDRIEKYVTASPTKGAMPERAREFIRFHEDEDGWLLTHDYGRVPIFHFSNNSAVGTFGVSELTNVVPLQDLLNKAIADMVVACEFVAFPQRWATGLEVGQDEGTGTPKAPWTPGVERLWAVANETTSFGQFPQADMTGFLQIQEHFRLEIARVSATPLHYLMLTKGEWPSGEAMKTAEARFLAKIRDRMASFGNAWEDVMTFALRVAGKEFADTRLSSDWEDPAPRSETDHVSALEGKMRLGVPWHQLMRELGYTEEEIQLMDDERQAAMQQQGFLRLGAGGPPDDVESGPPSNSSSSSSSASPSRASASSGDRRAT